MKLHSIIFSFIFILSFQISNAQYNSHKKNNYNSSWSNHSDLVNLVSNSDEFSTLAVALKTAGLIKTLQGDGPFTVIAPTNTAFAKLAEGTVASLLKPNNKIQLSNILTYHVIEGRFTAKDVISTINSSDGKFEIKTVNGGILTATLQSDTVLLTDKNGNKSAILKKDLDTSNGIAHVIDSVVLPNKSINPVINIL